MIVTKIVQIRGGKLFKFSFHVQRPFLGDIILITIKINSDLYSKFNRSIKSFLKVRPIGKGVLTIII